MSVSKRQNAVRPLIGGLAVAAMATGLAIGTAAAGGETIGYSAPFLSDPFQAIMADLTTKGAESAGLDLLPVTNANADAGKQITNVRTMLSQGAKGLIVVPVDSDAIIPALNSAAEKNVPVVTIDLGPAGGKVAMIVRADNSRMGEEACKVMGKAVGGKGKVLSLLGDQASINGRDRTTGFNNCMKAQFPDIEIIEQPTYWKTETATAAAQTVVGATPDLAGIYMQSDSVMLAGVLNVLKSAGKLKAVGEEGHLPLVSIDATPYALDQIRANMLDAAVSQPLESYVKFGLSYLEDAMAGKTFSTGPTDHDSQIVEFEGNLMDLLPSPVVTAENVDDAALWGNQVK
ncbi:MAG: sugar ABC transporter substrate-binding protein [Bauldia sp.]|nr:sugar ABC transporter substrate-binding protein [Bauldia sp.]